MTQKQANPTAKSKSGDSKSTQSTGGHSQIGLAATTEKTLTGDQVARARVDVSRLLPADVMSLQRSIGNRAVEQLLRRNATTSPRNAPLVQPKMTVGPASDAYEIEADKIARQVLRSPAAPLTKKEHDEEVSPIQRVPIIQHVQRSAPMGLQGGPLDAKLEGTLRSSQNGGSSLPNSVRQTLEPKLGADLSQVKVHTDAQAVQLNRDMGAKAFTHKNHIYYGAGQSPKDLSLTTHETVHTIQQGAIVQNGGREQHTANDIHRSPTTPTIQRIFGRNMKKRIKANAYPNIEPIVAKGQKGLATEAELRKALAKVEKYKIAAAKMKGVDVAERMDTLRMFGDELTFALDHIRVGASKKQAKDIYLHNARSGGLKALATSKLWFKEGGTASLEGQKHGLDQAESASLTAYSGNDFRYINPATAYDKKWMDAQKRAHVLPGTEKERFEEGGLHAAMMMQAMAKLPVWKGTGYRGERLTPAKFAEQYEETGRTVTARQATQVKAAFWSVSTDRSVAEGFAKEGHGSDQTISLLYFIDVTNARNLQGFSTSDEEEEVLCPAGSKVTVSRIEKQERGPIGMPSATAWYHVYLTQT